MDRQSEGVMLTPLQRLQAMETLELLVERYDGRISASAGPLALARQMGLIEKQRAKGRDGVPGRGTLAACGGVFSKLGVLHDGTVVPCHNLATLRMGSIGVDDLRELWLAHPLMEALRQRRSIPLETLETCQGCEYQGFCTGGCPAGALFLNGELNARNPMDCYRVHMGEDPFYEL
jgi:radical SAM protein with 4Fe4S-binding SPASM domain